MATIETVRQLGAKYSNWGRWGPDDELGTLNFCTGQEVIEATSLVRQGRAISLSIPLDENGPQTGGYRFNPIHLMNLDGSDAMADFAYRRTPEGHDAHLRSADDVLILPLQCGTQWDALSHIMFEKRMYNGYSAAEVTSRGARRLAITGARDRMIGRGVLLDLPKALDRPSLEPGYGIDRADLERAEALAGVRVQRGDFVLVRTGQMADVKARGEWGDYAGGEAPGLALDSVSWLHEREIAAVCTDTWGMEVRPNEAPDVFQPLHIILIVHMGLWVGEIFDLEELAQACAEEQRYEFLFTAPPLVVTGGVGSPINPLAVL